MKEIKNILWMMLVLLFTTTNAMAQVNTEDDETNDEDEITVTD